MAAAAARKIALNCICHSRLLVNHTRYVTITKHALKEGKKVKVVHYLFKLITSSGCLGYFCSLTLLELTETKPAYLCNLKFCFSGLTKNNIWSRRGEDPFFLNMTISLCIFFQKNRLSFEKQNPCLVVKQSKREEVSIVTL